MINDQNCVDIFDYQVSLVSLFAQQYDIK